MSGGTAEIGQQIHELLGTRNYREVCDVAGRLGRHLRRAQSEADREATLAVARALAREADVTVRELMAQSLAQAPGVPKDLARTLAMDLDSIAEPFLQQTTAFTDRELAALVEELPEMALVGMARRACVPGEVTERIAATGAEGSVTELSRNPGSYFTPTAYESVIARFSGRPQVIATLARRPGIPLEYLERVFTEVSEAMQRELARLHNLPDEGRQLVQRAQARAVFRSIKEAPAAKVVEQVSRLYLRGELRLELIEVALAEDHVLFFEVAMSRMAGVNMETARAMTRKGGTERTEELCRRAGYPASVSQRLAMAVERSLQRGV